ncbi:MAG: aminomethyl-transferring glycine dehydrogenase subunit GcvPA, partial [Chloroflexota bacterium]
VEATTIAINETGRDHVVVAGGVHPEYRQVLATYLHAQGFRLVELDEDWSLDPEAIAARLDQSVAALIVQSPNFWGALEPMAAVSLVAKQAGALFVSVNNPLSLALLAPPGEYGADIAVGCGQPLGIPLMYGGPYLGIIAVRSGLERRLPGRIAGMTTDHQGQRGFVLTLQAREQHIRREKATSNICTNHALMALAATVYLSLVGKAGLRETALQCVHKAHYAAVEIAKLTGFSLAYDAPFFNEFTVRTPVPAAEVNRFLLGRQILGGLDLAQFDGDRTNQLLLAFTEMTTRQEIDDLVATLATLSPTPETATLQSASVGGGS